MMPLTFGHAVASFVLIRRSMHRPVYVSYQNTPVEHNNQSPIENVPTSLFLRVTMEGNYENVVEIGTYTGKVIATLKRLVPSINAYGVDVGPTFDRPFVFSGVNFQKYDSRLSILDQLTGSTLVIARGTLSCFNESELNHFAEQVSIRPVDLAIYDLYPNFSIDTTINRSDHEAFMTFFYDYSGIFSLKGMRVICDATDVNDWVGRPYSSESWRFLYFGQSV